MQRNIMRTLTAAALSTVGLIGIGTATADATTATPAVTTAAADDSATTAAADDSAAPAEVGINAAKFYFFKDDNRHGGYAYVTGSDRDLRNNRWLSGPHKGRTINNGTSSVNNTTSHFVVLSDHAGSCVGPHYYSNAHSSDNDLSNNGFDNKASCVTFR
ncbi:hypothetical protein [Streptomyces sp. NEAU-L66]|uniref:hypothetical protein n=1 Tax=Streptomyces sp. NEAU-L66 TaxID=3390812 RepID=UPI0039C6E1DB